MMDVLYRILRFLYYIFRWIMLYHLFGDFHRTSYMARPLRLVHPHYIHVGPDVSILGLARMECIRFANGQACQGEIWIGRGTSLEQGCHLIAGDKLQIGEDVTISAYVYIADSGHGIQDISCDVMDQPLEIRHTQIGDGAFIGIGARVMPGVTIGKHAIVGANAVVSRDVPDYCMVAGVPARVIKQYDFDRMEWVSCKQ